MPVNKPPFDRVKLYSYFNLSMLKNSPSTLAHANSLLRKREFEDAIAAYRSALSEAKGPLFEIIQFNIDWAMMRKNESADHLKGSIRPNMTPAHQIEADELGSSQWRSTGNDPYFILEPKHIAKFFAGWYEIEIILETPQKRKISTLYPDYGSGFSEETSIIIALGRDSLAVTKQVIKFEQNLFNLRFDPMNRPGSFSINTFQIRSLTEKQAKGMMMDALKMNSESPLNPDKDLQSIDEIYQDYRSSVSVKPEQVSYRQWLDEVELPNLPSMSEVQHLLKSIKLTPLISVVVPTYNIEERYLRVCIESVIQQSYPFWELCIADDASDQPHVRKVLDEYKQKNVRIKVIFREKNGHISRASNSALELATGQYVALLDHDDELSLDALYFVALAINETPSAQVIYSDEDKIDAKSERSDPHFKSDWNPDLFYSQNYVSHLGVYKRELLNRIGGFRIGVEGAQDQDLLLRCLPYLKPGEIIHIPRILYHWRMLSGSTAKASSEKNYTTQAGLRALSHHFEANGPAGLKLSEGLLPNTYRVHWPIPKPEPLVSLLIPTRDKKEILEVAVRSILEKTTYRHYEIVILDNGSKEIETLQFFVSIQKQNQNVKVLRYDKPFNFAAINNFGAKHASGSIIGLINNDVEVISADWLAEMVSHALRPDVGCVGAKLYYPDGRIQHAGVVLGLGGVAGHSHRYFGREEYGYFYRLMLTQSYSAVTAACLLVRKEIYEAVGGLDEQGLAVAFNDVDFCIRVSDAGYRTVWTPFAELYHHESFSRGADTTPAKKRRFQMEFETMQTRWGSKLLKDPFYNSNLTMNLEDFSMIGDR